MEKHEKGVIVCAEEKGTVPINWQGPLPRRRHRPGLQPRPYAQLKEEPYNLVQLLVQTVRGKLSLMPYA